MNCSIEAHLFDELGDFVHLSLHSTKLNEKN